MRRRLAQERGQVAMETLVVMFPWLVVVVMFFNLAFYLGSVMLSQSLVNRLALEAGAIGCMPPLVLDRAESDTGMGMVDLTITAKTTADGTSNFADANLKNAECAHSGDGEPIRGPFVPGNGFIRVRATYNQYLLFFGEQDVTSQAMIVSQRREQDS